MGSGSSSVRGNRVQVFLNVNTDPDGSRSAAVTRSYLAIFKHLYQHSSLLSTNTSDVPCGSVPASHLWRRLQLLAAACIKKLSRSVKPVKQHESLQAIYLLLSGTVSVEIF